MAADYQPQLAPPERNVPASTEPVQEDMQVLPPEDRCLAGEFDLAEMCEIIASIIQRILYEETTTGGPTIS